MKRKDYELIAASLKLDYEHKTIAAQTPGEQACYTYAVAMVAQHLAKAFRNNNPRFDADKFLAACGCYPKDNDGKQLSI